jgi:hypothetical protein
VLSPHSAVDPIVGSSVWHDFDVRPEINGAESLSDGMIRLSAFGLAGILEHYS